MLPQFGHVASLFLFLFFYIYPRNMLVNGLSAPGVISCIVHVRFLFASSLGVESNFLTLHMLFVSSQGVNRNFDVEGRTYSANNTAAPQKVTSRTRMGWPVYGCNPFVRHISEQKR